MIEIENSDKSVEIEFKIVKEFTEEIIIGIDGIDMLEIKILDSNMNVLRGNIIKKYKKESVYYIEEQKENINKSQISEFIKVDEKENYATEIKAIVAKYKEKMSKDTSLSVDVKHEIRLKDPTLFTYQQPYNKSYKENEIIQEEVRRMKDLKLIRDSDSGFAAPVVLAKKPDGSLRFCVDYRKINMNTVTQPYPIPPIEDVINCLEGANIFSKLDMEARYHQVSINEEDKKTAFITREGHYEWNKMPFGLINAPFTFQKIMNKIFKEFKWKFVNIYLDDLMSFPKMWINIKCI